MTTTTTATPLADRELELIDAYWRAANYLSVGQIYLLDNPLLREPLRREHVKPRLLGHWGTTPGLNFVYAHLNRAIKARDLSAIYITGPGHGGPGLVANAYLEGTYSELYPHVSEDEEAVLSAIVAGASGYLLKQIRGRDLVSALEAVGRGESLLDPAVTERVLERVRRIATGQYSDELSVLTPQEQKILLLVAEGKTNKEIASDVFLSDKTVKNYVSSILAKLNLERRAQAAAFVAKHRLDGGG